MELAFLRGTKGRILRLLRRGTLTADEIAQPLEVTPNGVRFHLAELERDGLVEQRPVRRGPRKPSHGYSLTDGGEALFPRQYDTLLNAVLRDVRAREGDAAVEALFRRLGTQLAGAQAARFAALPPDATEARAREALRYLDSIGGVATLEASSDGVPIGAGAGEGTAIVAGASCPFKAVVAEHPEACCLLETFLTHALPGAEVHEVCQKGDTPRCRFTIERQER